MSPKLNCLHLFFGRDKLKSKDNASQQRINAVLPPAGIVAIFLCMSCFTIHGAQLHMALID